MAVIRRSRYGFLRSAARTVAGAAGGLFGRRAIGYGVRTSGRLANSSSRTLTRTSRATRSGVGVTTDRDFRNVYRKRRMPARKRRQWKRFVRKVDAVAERKRGTLSCVFNTVHREAVGDNLQRMWGITLFGYRGTTAAGQDSYDRDMYEIANSTKPGDAPVSVEFWNRKIHFRSGVLDITFRNVHATNAVELDLYEYTVKKDVPFSRLIDLIINSQSDPAAVTMTGVDPLTHDDVGTTPFQIPSALKYITILKKTKVFIPVSGTATYQIRKPQNRWWSTTELDEKIGTYAKRGWTVGLWLVQKGVPGMIAGVATRALASDVVASVTRTYCLKTIDTQELDTSGYVPS